LVGHGGLDERDEVRLVARDAEIGHGIIAGRFIKRIPVQGKVVRAHANAAEVEVAAVRIEQRLQGYCALVVVQRLQRLPAEFVEASAEAVHGLVEGLRFELHEVWSVARPARNADGPFFPRVRCRAANPVK